MPLLYKASASPGGTRSGRGSGIQTDVLRTLNKDHNWLRLGKGERLTVDSPLLVRKKKGKMVPDCSIHNENVQEIRSLFSLGQGDHPQPVAQD